jgi:type II secretion system protein J
VLPRFVMKIQLKQFNRSAFTLLELLVAMALMVIVSGGLYTSLYTGFKSKRSSERAVLPLITLQAAMDMFAQDVQGAVEPNTTLAGAFEGLNDKDGSSRDTDSLTLYTSHHQINGDTSRITCGVGLIELLLEEDEDADTYNLVRYVTDNLLSTETTNAIQEILCRNVRAMNLRYYDGSGWLDDWMSEDHLDALPLALEMTLELEPTQETLEEIKSTSRYSKDYQDAIPKLTQVVTIPCGVSEDVLEAAQAETETGGGGGAGMAQGGQAR